MFLGLWLFVMQDSFWWKQRCWDSLRYREWSGEDVLISEHICRLIANNLAYLLSEQIGRLFNL